MTNDFLWNEFGIASIPAPLPPVRIWADSVYKRGKTVRQVCSTAVRYSAYLLVWVAYMYVFSWLNTAYDASSDELSAQVLASVGEIQWQVWYLTDVIADEAVRVLSIVHW